MNKNQMKRKLKDLSDNGWIEKDLVHNIEKYYETEKSRRFISDMIRDMMDRHKYFFTYDGMKELEGWVKTGEKTSNVIGMIDLLIIDITEKENN